MAVGPGVYDDLCTEARQKVHAEGLLLIVIKGEHGNGFSCQVPPAMMMILPEMLESIAAQIRADRVQLIAKIQES